MAMYSVSMMVPFTVEVEADSFEEAMDKAFLYDEADFYGGDGVFIRNLETDETYEA